MTSAGPNSQCLAEKYGLRPARTGHHVRTFDAVFQRVCAHQRQTTHRPTAAAQTTTAVAARRRRHRPRLLPPWRRQSCAGARCACRLPAAPAALLSRCALSVPAPVPVAVGHGSCWPAALLPVEDQEEEAPRAHLRAGTQPARGSNPGRAVRLREVLSPPQAKKFLHQEPESSAKMTGSRMAFASRG